MSFFYFFDASGAWALLAVLQFCYSHGLAINNDSITQVFLQLLTAASVL